MTYRTDAGADGLSRTYLEQIRRAPLLTEDEERELAIRWRSLRDSRARSQLVESHLRIVVKLARGYKGYGLPIADLVSEGTIGLMQAVEKFDPHHGARLSTYASWWIRAAIGAYVLRSWSLVKVGPGRAQRKLFFKLRSIRMRLGAADHADLSPEAVDLIADELGVSAADVVDMNRRMMGPDLSLNTPMGPLDQDAEWQDLLADERNNQEAELGERQSMTLRSGLLVGALASLNPRERDIFLERRLNEAPPILDELAKRYAISEERVRQIEMKALAKVQSAVRAGDRTTRGTALSTVEAAAAPSGLTRFRAKSRVAHAAKPVGRLGFEGEAAAAA